MNFSILNGGGAEQMKKIKTSKLGDYNFSIDEIGKVRFIVLINGGFMIEVKDKKEVVQMVVYQKAVKDEFLNNFYFAFYFFT